MYACEASTRMYAQVQAAGTSAFRLISRSFLDDLPSVLSIDPSKTCTRKSELPGALCECLVDITSSYSSQ